MRPVNLQKLAVGLPDNASPEGVKTTLSHGSTQEAGGHLRTITAMFAMSCQFNAAREKTFHSRDSTD